MKILDFEVGIEQRSKFGENSEKETLTYSFKQFASWLCHEKLTKIVWTTHYEKIWIIEDSEMYGSAQQLLYNLELCFQTL